MKNLLGPLFLSLIVVSVIWGLIKFERTGHIFDGNSDQTTIALADLLSFANFYDGKKVCTRGYYVLGDRLSIFKVSLGEDSYTRSTWVNMDGSEIIRPIPSNVTRSVDAQICGLFEFHRGGDFGEPAVWNSQITVESFKTFSYPVEVRLP